MKSLHILLALICSCIESKKPNIVFILTDDLDVAMGGMVSRPAY